MIFAFGFLIKMSFDIFCLLFCRYWKSLWNISIVFIGFGSVGWRPDRVVRQCGTAHWELSWFGEESNQRYQTGCAIRQGGQKSKHAALTQAQNSRVDYSCTRLRCLLQVAKYLEFENVPLTSYFLLDLKRTIWWKIMGYENYAQRQQYHRSASRATISRTSVSVVGSLSSFIWIRKPFWAQCTD